MISWSARYVFMLEQQMRFNPDLFELIPKEQLDADFGGDFEYEFEPNSYWEQIVSYVSQHAIFWSFIHDGMCRFCKIAPDGTRLDDAAPKPTEDTPGDAPVVAVAPPIETLAEEDAIRCVPSVIDSSTCVKTHSDISREEANSTAPQGLEEISVIA